MVSTSSSFLSALRDVDGVVGSFLVGPEGALLARDLPQMFDDQLLDEIGPRIRRITDGLSETGENPGCVVLHFGDHKLWLKPADEFTLCVLAAVQVNRPALRMALTLVARRVAPLLAAGSELGFASFATPLPPTTISSRAPDTLVSSKVPDAPATPSKRALYRGRPVED